MTYTDTTKRESKVEHKQKISGAEKVKSELEKYGFYYQADDAKRAMILWNIFMDRFESD